MLYEKLTELKKKHALTNEEISALSGIPEGTVSKIMSGTTVHPSFENVQDILRAMGESMSSISDESTVSAIHDSHGHAKNSHDCANCQRCISCPALASSRESYTHAYEEMKKLYLSTDRWLRIITLYAMILTAVAVYLAAVAEF